MLLGCVANDDNYLFRKRSRYHVFFLVIIRLVRAKLEDSWLWGEFVPDHH